MLQYCTAIPSIMWPEENSRQHSIFSFHSLQTSRRAQLKSGLRFKISLTVQDPMAVGAVDSGPRQKGQVVDLIAEPWVSHPNATGDITP